MARTPKVINWDIVIKRMQVGNTARQIAKEHDINIDTFYDRFKKEFGVNFADYSDGCYEVGKGNILFTQYMKALSGHPGMLQHLGKFMCGQVDSSVQEVNPRVQEDIDKDHLIMRLQHQIAVLEADADKRKTE